MFPLLSLEVHTIILSIRLSWATLNLKTILPHRNKQTLDMNVCALRNFSKRFYIRCISVTDAKSDIDITTISRSNLYTFLRHLSSSSEQDKKVGDRPVLRLLTKENCMLCEEAKHKLFSARGNYDERLVLKEVDIRAEGNEDLFGLYRYEIPVFFLGKKFISKNFIDLVKLEEELKKIEN